MNQTSSTTYRTTNGLTAGQLRDICDAIVARVGIPAYNAWARPIIDNGNFGAAAERRLLDLMGRGTRSEDRAHFEQLCDAHREARIVAKHAQFREFDLMMEAIGE